MSNMIPDIVPRDELSRAAYEFVKPRVHSSILSHSLRVFHYASQLSERIPAKLDVLDRDTLWHLGNRQSLLFTACMFHDFGTSTVCQDGPYRFEVEGADAAASFLKSQGATAEDAHAVWVAIACHICPHVGERISNLAKLIRQGPQLDFHRYSGGKVAVLEHPPVELGDGLYVLAKDRERIEGLLPREEIEKVLSGTVIQQAQRPGREGKAPVNSWPADLVRSAKENPDWTGVNKAF